MRSIAPLLLLVVHLVHAQSAWTLEQCVARAEERNLTLRGALLDTELADRTREQSFWSFFPDLNGGATHGYNYGRVIDRFTNTFATDRVRTNNFFLSSDLTVFNGLRLHNERRRAGLDLEAAQEAGDAVRNDVRSTVAQQFIEVLSAEERIRAAEAQLASTSQQTERMQALVDAGRNARSELINLRSQQAQQEFTLVDLRNRREQALLQLAQTLQLTSDELRGFSVTSPALSAMSVAEPTADVETVLAVVLAQDPLYRQAELRASSAERGVASPGPAAIRCSRSTPRPAPVTPGATSRPLATPSSALRSRSASQRAMRPCSSPTWTSRPRCGPSASSWTTTSTNRSASPFRCPSSTTAAPSWPSARRASSRSGRSWRW
ncbi:MAG: TolC family protein [Flavobacteriales bacterium]|nr:TolC family protein [Flavobacteriales bacterium]